MVERPQNPSGDPLSGPVFEEVFLPHLDAAYNLARWLLRNDEDAEDCVQDAYLRAYKAFPRFRGGNGKAWFMTIVRNVCYTTIKKLRSHEAVESFDEEVHCGAGSEAETEALRKMTNVETLQKGLDKLPPDFREMIVLHDLEGHSYKEMAMIIGIPIGTVMSRLARARDRLRTEIITSSSEESSP